MSTSPVGLGTVLWMGAEAAGGLTLPDAMPTAHQMYAPRGVWLDDERLVVCDTGNHRVLIWHDVTQLRSHGDADVVLGPARLHHRRRPGRRPGTGGRHAAADRRARPRRPSRRRRRLEPPHPDLGRRCRRSSDRRPDVVLGQADAVVGRREPRRGVRPAHVLLAVRHRDDRRPVLRRRHRQSTRPRVERAARPR